MPKPRARKTKALATGWAVFKSGFWVICSTEYLAYMENGGSLEGIREVILQPLPRTGE